MQLKGSLNVPFRPVMTSDTALMHKSPFPALVLPACRLLCLLLPGANSGNWYVFGRWPTVSFYLEHKQNKTGMCILIMFNNDPPLSFCSVIYSLFPVLYLFYHF